MELFASFSPPSVFFLSLSLIKHRGSSVNIATHYPLYGPGFESRFGVRFSAPVQTDPVSYTMGTVYLSGGKAGRAGRGVALTTHPSSAEVKERVELYLLLLFWAFVACSRVKFSLFRFTSSLSDRSDGYSIETNLTINRRQK